MTQGKDPNVRTFKGVKYYAAAVPRSTGCHECDLRGLRLEGCSHTNSCVPVFRVDQRNVIYLTLDNYAIYRLTKGDELK
jgi:hypothetical protein